MNVEAIEARHRRGADRWDEMWHGNLHMAPMPTMRDRDLGTGLLAVLRPLARERGMKISYEIGLFGADDDYRVLDLGVYRPDQASARGLENAAELVVELVSPGDESRAKLPWYATRVREVVLVDRDTLSVELFRMDGAEPHPVDPPASEVLGCAFERLDDDHLRVVTPGGAEVVTP